MRLRLPEFLDTRDMKVAKLPAQCTGHLYPQEIYLLLSSVKRLSRPQGPQSMKNPKASAGNRTATFRRHRVPCNKQDSRIVVFNFPLTSTGCSLGSESCSCAHHEVLWGSGGLPFTHTEPRRRLEMIGQLHAPTVLPTASRAVLTLWSRQKLYHRRDWNHTIIELTRPYRNHYTDLAVVLWKYTCGGSITASVKSQKGICKDPCNDVGILFGHILDGIFIRKDVIRFRLLVTMFRRKPAMLSI